MRNITLNNGKQVLISNNKDIVEVIADNLSYELSEMVSNRIVDIDKERLYQAELARTDADGYLSDIESKESCLNEVLDIAEELSEYIEDAKRINKEKIYQKINDIISIIGNEL